MRRLFFSRNATIKIFVIPTMGKDASTLANYRVETYPSTYLLNAAGKVVYKSVGIDEAGLLRALKELGLQK